MAANAKALMDDIVDAVLRKPNSGDIDTASTFFYCSAYPEDIVRGALERAEDDRRHGNYEISLATGWQSHLAKLAQERKLSLSQNHF